MEEENRLDAAFEQARPHLRAVAFRLLGSVADADDALQDAWLRASAQESSAIHNRAAWLTTIVSRICLDKLKARRRRRAEPWQEEGEPSAASASAEEEHLLAESVGLAMLVVLERLTPLERVAFVLHDAFSLPFEEIARVVDRSVVATKKLASRARQRVYGAEPLDADAARHREVVEAFLAAAREGDVEGLVAVLAPDIVRRADSVARGEGTPAELHGAPAVAKEIASNQARAAYASLLLVDGVPGAVVAPFGRLRFVLAFSVANGRVTAFEVMGARDSLDERELRLLPRSR
jgi:RNA polymerase sigma factor (sigma-70 family)